MLRNCCFLPLNVWREAVLNFDSSCFFDENGYHHWEDFGKMFGTTRFSNWAYTLSNKDFHRCICEKDLRCLENFFVRATRIQHQYMAAPMTVFFRVERLACCRQRSCHDSLLNVRVSRSLTWARNAKHLPLQSLIDLVLSSTALFGFHLIIGGMKSRDRLTNFEKSRCTYRMRFSFSVIASFAMSIRKHLSFPCW